MSRSYRHKPILKDSRSARNRSTGTSMKTIANRRFRRTNKIFSEFEEDYPTWKGSQYKKYTEPWEICDWWCRETKEEAIREYNRIQKEAAPGPIYGEITYWTLQNGEWNKVTRSVVLNRMAIDLLKKYPTLEDWLWRWYKTYKMK